MFEPLLKVVPNWASNSDILDTTVGIKAGPLTVGPIIAAPMSPTADGKNEASISLVNTPGDTIFSAIYILP